MRTANADQKDTDHDGIGDVCEGEDQGVGTLTPIGEPISAIRFVGDKRYELSNHLGNVLSVITDRKIVGGVTGYLADVISYSDYDPYGMQVPNRFYNGADYRYGLQGQEKDNEIKGEGNSLNYTFRMHDPRIGRFFAIDPLAPKYPFYTPYQFSGNRVIDMVELEGLEPAEPGTTEGQKGSAFDKSLLTDNPGDVLKFMVSYQEWTWHAGTKTTEAGWKTKDNYKQIVMPFALDMAKSQGYRAGSTWQEGQALYNTIVAPPSEVSAETKHFLTSRVWDGQSALDEISKIGISEINKYNRSIYTSATGAIESMEFSSPFFGMGFGLKPFATGSKTINLYRAVSGEELIDVAANGFRNNGGYETGKLFANSAQDASNYGRLFFGADKKPFFILKTSIDTKYEAMFFRTEMDLMEGVSVPSEVLKEMKNTSVIDGIPLPNHPWIKN